MIIKQIHSINASQKPKLSTAQYERNFFVKILFRTFWVKNIYISMIVQTVDKNSFRIEYPY